MQAFQFISTYVGLLRVRAVEGEPGRFHVGNATDYLVDLAENLGLGQCGCPDFAFNRRKLLEEEITALPEEPNRYRCKHIKAARSALGAQMVDEAMRMLNERTEIEI